MNTWERMQNIADNVKDHGYHIQHGLISDSALENYIERVIPEFMRGYSDWAVNRKLYRKREDTAGRLGDACMVSMTEPDTAPYIRIEEDLAGLYLLYLQVLNYLTGVDTPDNTKCLFNYQFYKEGASNSLPFHFDAEIFEGDWTKEYIEIHEGLIPRLVMVIVLENENNGKGLSIMTHQGVKVDLNMIPGDILFFDNTKVLHGVPEDLPKKRSMMGFRSFEIAPLYFKKDGFETGQGAIGIDTPYMKGEAIQLTTKEAKEMLVKQGWYY